MRAPCSLDLNCSPAQPEYHDGNFQLPADLEYYKHPVPDLFLLLQFPEKIQCEAARASQKAPQARIRTLPRFDRDPAADQKMQQFSLPAESGGQTVTEKQPEM